MPQIKFIETPDFFMGKHLSKNPMPFMHHHLAFEIFYIIKGEREYFIDNEFFKLQTGDLAIIPQNVLHRTDGKAASRYLIYFSYNYLTKYLSPKMISALSIHQPLIFRPDETQREGFAFIFNSMFSEYTKSTKDIEPQSNTRLAGYLQQLLLMITNTCNAYVPEKYSDIRIESIIKYINENYSNIGEIEEIAARFYISKYHLCRLFNKNLGVGLISYLNTIKIRKACEMLEQKKLGITEIAAACGFNSSSYFCKVFKAEKGTSPSDYRKQRNIKIKSK